MKYYEVNLSGNHLINFLTAHSEGFLAFAISIALISLFGVIFFLLDEKMYNPSAGILFLGLFLISTIGPTVFSSIQKSTEYTYYTSAEEVTSWTENSVYLYNGNTEESEVPKNAPKLITRTTDKIKANSSTGSAYLRVTQYLVDYHSSINNVQIHVSMDKTEASFDSVDGQQKIVSYANGKKQQPATSTVKVLKWQK